MRKFLLFFLLASFTFHAQVPSPKSHFGFNIGDSYHLANFTQTEIYLKKMAAKSNRMKLQSIGLTEEGRNQYMVIVSDPSNIQQLAKYKNISQRLARAENLTELEAAQLAKEGKAVVWIDGGLHATETVGIHQWIESIYQFATRNDEETKRILQNTIILFVHANPDGQELVSNWYMRNSDTLKRSKSNLPRLYQKYIGHDNNRDFYMMNMSESINMSRQQYIEWMPQILYNHHQTGPEGTVVAGPPYRDPFNYVFDPLLVTGIDALGAAMSSRLNAEGKPGYTMKSGSVYSTWWNGGLRTTAYFHNMIGLLTEIIGDPSPSSIPLVPNRLIPNASTPFPITPQKWVFKNSIDYSLSLNYAVLNYAARYREELLMNIYRMGKKSTDLGSKDYWTLSPNKVEKLMEISGGQYKNKSDSLFRLVYKNPKTRDARAYIVSANQSTSSVAFINILIKSGIRVEKAMKDFEVGGKMYPKGSFIVKANQAFRPHILDMFEAQDHPNDFQYPGGPPVRPYDSAGWTPAFTMGVEFDRILEELNGPFESIPYGEIQVLKPNFELASFYAFLASDNSSFTLLNDLLKVGAQVYKNKNNFYVAHSASNAAILAKSNVKIESLTALPSDVNRKIGKRRIGLWDTFGGSMPSGWLRWILEQHHFDFKLVFAKEIDRGNLGSNYDVLIFVRGAIPALKPETGEFEEKEALEADIPNEFHETMGKITAAKSIPSLRSFLEAGGDIVTIGSSSNLAYQLNLPVKSALVEMVAGKERNLSAEKFYIPGSVMQVSMDQQSVSNWGMGPKVDVYFAGSPVFKLSPESISHGDLTPLAWYSSDKNLRSGWAFGQAYLQDGVAAFKAKVGHGTLYVYGPEITFRGQTHSTFKLVFNQLFDLKGDEKKH